MKAYQAAVERFVQDYKDVGLIFGNAPVIKENKDWKDVSHYTAEVSLVRTTAIEKLLFKEIGLRMTVGTFLDEDDNEIIFVRGDFKYEHHDYGSNGYTLNTMNIFPDGSVKYREPLVRE